MEKNDLFLFDAQSSIGQAVLKEVPRGFQVHAWTDQAIRVEDISLPRKASLHGVSLEQATTVGGDAAAATHVVITTDCLYRAANIAELKQWADIVKKCYDACSQGRTRVFIFVSTVDVCEKESLPSAKKAVRMTEEAQTAFEIESYLMKAAENRALKPVILRIGMPYGGMSHVGVFEIYQMVSLFAMVCEGVPKFSAGRRIAVIHVEEVARAVAFLLAQEGGEKRIFHLAEGEVFSPNGLVAMAAQCLCLPEWRKGGIGSGALETLWKVAQKFGGSGSLCACVKRLWKQVCKSYGLYPTPAPELSWLFGKGGTSKVVARNLEKMGFVRTRPDLRECLSDVYAEYCRSRYLPQLMLAPQRPEALVNRVSFQQRWTGCIQDPCDAGTSVPVVMLFHAEMPLWHSYCFGEPVIQGTFLLESRLKVAVRWTRDSMTWRNVFSLEDVSFDFMSGTQKLRFVSQPTRCRIIPQTDFVILNEQGETRYSGTLKLDVSPGAIVSFFSSIEFVR